MDVYDNIENLLKERNMNKKQLSEKIGIPYTTLMSSFNRKSKSISYEMLSKIADILGVSFDEMLTVGEKKEKLVSGFALEDYLRRFGYILGGDSTEGYLWIDHGRYSYEIDAADLEDLEKATEAFVKFQVNEVLNRSRRLPIDERRGEY